MLMEKLAKNIGFALCVLSLSACQTIDEERFAALPCDDIKQLVAQDNFASLSQSRDFFTQTRDEYNNTDAIDLFSFDKDTQYSAELRAAFRNHCN